jgi:hypothetical protein
MVGPRRFVLRIGAWSLGRGITVACLDPIDFLLLVCLVKGYFHSTAEKRKDYSTRHELNHRFASFGGNCLLLWCIGVSSAPRGPRRRQSGYANS